MNNLPPISKEALETIRESIQIALSDTGNGHHIANWATFIVSKLTPAQLGVRISDGVLFPNEPTEKILCALSGYAGEEDDSWRERAQQVWRNVLAASQEEGNGSDGPKAYECNEILGKSGHYKP